MNFEQCIQGAKAETCEYEMNIFHARCYVAYEPNSVIVDPVT